MEAYVQMPLETYDTLKFNNEYLKEITVKAEKGKIIIEQKR